MKNVYVVTGGAGGIGLEAAKRFRDGIVLLADISVDNLETAKVEMLALGINTETHKIDLSDRESIEQLMAYANSLGNIKVLVNSAGVSGDQAPVAPLLKINLLGSQIIIEEALKYMNGGSIVMISSMMGHSVERSDEYLDALVYPERDGSLELLEKVIDGDGTKAYNFTKRGVTELVKRYAYAAGKKGIRINSISPGVIMTAMARQAEKEHPETMQDLYNMTPLARAGEVEDIGNIVEFLVSDKASFITGTDILADGGLIIEAIKAGI